MVEPDVKRYSLEKEELFQYNPRKKIKIKNGIVEAKESFAFKAPTCTKSEFRSTRLVCMTSVSFDIYVKNGVLKELNFAKLYKKTKSTKKKFILQKGSNIFSFQKNEKLLKEDSWNSIEVFFGPKHTIVIINGALGIPDMDKYFGYEQVFSWTNYLGIFGLDEKFSIRNLAYKDYLTAKDFLIGASMNLTYQKERTSIIEKTFYSRYNPTEFSISLEELNDLAIRDPWSKFWLTFFKYYTEYDFKYENVIKSDDEWKIAFLMMGHGFIHGNEESEFLMSQLFDFFEPKESVRVIGGLFRSTTERFKKGFEFLGLYEILKNKREEQKPCSFFIEDPFCSELVDIKDYFRSLVDKLPNDIMSQTIDRTGRYDFWSDLANALNKEDAEKSYNINYAEGISRLAKHQFSQQEITDLEKKFERLIDLGMIQNSIVSALFVTYCAQKKYIKAENLINKYGADIIISNERNPYGPKYDVSPGNIAQLYFLLGKKEKALNYLTSYTSSIPNESRRVWLELYEVFWTIAEIQNIPGLSQEVREACLDGYQNRKTYSKQACIWCLERNDPAVIDYFANLYYEKKQQSLSMKWDYYNVVNENKNIGLEGDEIYYANSKSRYQWNKLNKFDSELITTKEKRFDYDAETGKYTPDGYDYNTFTRNITTKRSVPFEPDILSMMELIKFQFPDIRDN